MALTTAAQKIIGNTSEVTHSFGATQTDSVPAPAAAPNNAPSNGPTGFWQRIGSVGIGKVNLFNAAKTAKSVGNAAVESEKVAGRGIARILPGGTNDLKAQENASNQAAKDLLLAHQSYKSGRITKDQFVKIAKDQAGNAASTTQDVNKTIDEMPTTKELAAGIGGTGLDLATAGIGGKLVKGGAKYTLNKGVQRGVRGAAEKVVDKISGKVGLSVGSAGAGAANAVAGGGDKKQTAEQGAAGAALPIVGRLVGKAVGDLFRGGPKAALDRVKSVGKVKSETGGMADVMDTGTADKVRQIAHTQVPVKDASGAAESVGVRTPVRPGIKQISQTDQIGVRAPVKITDQEYTKRFEKLSADHDREMKALEKTTTKTELKPTATSKILNKDGQEPIEGYHHSNELAKDYADMLRQMDDGMQGGIMVDNTGPRDAHGSGRSRTSEHTPFYRKYFEDNGRAPSQRAYLEHAKEELGAGRGAFGASDGYKQLIEREANPPAKFDPKTDTKPAKTIQTSVPIRTQIMAERVAQKYDRLLKELDNAHQYGVMPEKTTIKKVTSSVSPAAKTTGGTPREKFTGIPGKTSVPAVNPGKKVPEMSAKKGGEVPTSVIKSEARAVEAGLVKEFESTASYKKTGYTSDAENAVKLSHENPEKALDIATGKTRGTSPSHEVAVRRAVERKATAEGDTDTLQALANSTRHTETAQAAQRLGAEAYNADETSAVDTIRRIMHDRAEAAAQKTGVKTEQALAKTTKEIEQHETSPTKSEWSVFVESIKC